jgi:ankyrin repeat protein
VKLLCDHGADVEAYVPGDETPLISAARAGHRSVVDYLVSRGANVGRAVPADSENSSEMRRH